MSKTILVSYAGASDPAFDAMLRAAQAALVASARTGGVDGVVSWDLQRLVETPFYQQNQGILDVARGGGYWLWKPYIILDTLRDIAHEDDFVIYWDVGSRRPNAFT